MAASLIKEAKKTTCLRFNIERDLDLKLLLFNSGYYDVLLLKPAPWKLAPWLRYFKGRLTDSAVVLLMRMYSWPRFLIKIPLFTMEIYTIFWLWFMYHNNRVKFSLISYTQQ